MLSRVEDVRVFESPDDVILRSSSRRYSCQQLNGEDVEENEQLHPQHPYRMRKRVLQRGNENFHQLNEEDEQVLVPFWNQESNRPMEFVFLSSGEIRAREDCPPGLGLPKLQDQGANVSRRLAYNTQEVSDESDDEDTRVSIHRNQMMKLSRQQVQRPGERQNSERSNSLASSLRDADVSSDSGSELDASKVSEESREEAGAAFQARHKRQATRNAESRVNTHDRSRRRASPHSLNSGHSRLEDEGMSDFATSRAQSVLAEDIYQEKSPISAASTRESARRERPAPLEQVPQMSQLKETNDVRTRRTKRSPKMEVSHLASEEPTPQVKDVTAYSARRNGSRVKKEDKVASQLESELQKEKKRVLEKMTQLLDEQGKNQQLRDQIEALEARLASKDRETGDKIQVAAWEQDKPTQPTEKEKAVRINTLEEQVRAQEVKISRLKHDKEELNTALKQLRKTGNNVPNTRRLDTEATGIVREELDEMTRRLQEFLAQVEIWKDNSKKEMQHCNDQTGLPAMLERLWLDFPRFPGVSANVAKEKSSSTSEQQHREDQVEAVHFLKKRLRQREEELRQIHVKYVELKELCARQCVREADLQNFINEHRLRGNLIIRKTDSIKPNDAASNQEPVQDDQPHRSTKLKKISTRGTNTPASYTERGGEENDFSNDEYSDNQEDNDGEEGDEEGDDYEYPVRTPKVFVQVGHDGVYEHASPTDSAIAQKLASHRTRERKKQQQRVERIRLVPSPSLTQRHERVPTPTSTTRRKTSAQHSMSQTSSSRLRPATLGECPPGCGSRPSFMRRKTPTAARAKAVKRPVSKIASKGSVGVIRPWM